jgi:hypothetical protein
MGVRESMVAELDAALVESRLRWQAIRDAERDVRRMQDEVQVFDVKAHRLRMALFAIDGEKDKTAADANIANSRRQAELREQG